MARKNIFDSVMRSEQVSSDVGSAAEPRKFGAAKSLSASIDELTKNASKITDGSTVVELDTSLLDSSFVADRLHDDDDQDYQDLLIAIRDRGQDSPILVRPHPNDVGRYMIVFGHRRVRVASELGRPVRAVIKPMADLEHIVSQGQENSARANLSFIERVIFASRLETLGYERESIQTALSVDYQTISKMLTIPKVIAEPVLIAIGSAKGIGRDRWLELRKLIEVPSNKLLVDEKIKDPQFLSMASTERFNGLVQLLKSDKSGKPIKKSLRSNNAWAPVGKSISVTSKAKPKAMSLEFSDVHGKPFAAWINNNLDDLFGFYEADEKSVNEQTGD